MLLDVNPAHVLVGGELHLHPAALGEQYLVAFAKKQFGDKLGFIGGFGADGDGAQGANTGIQFGGVGIGGVAD